MFSVTASLKSRATSSGLPTYDNPLAASSDKAISGSGTLKLNHSWRTPGPSSEEHTRLNKKLF
jgi:hypothetical protein